jgi:NAD(P)-dependent dehydrogenase (short-subunit alcohol dehydrogenase family)
MRWACLFIFIRIDPDVDTLSSLRDKVVFITGSSSGIGVEMMHAFAAQCSNCWMRSLARELGEFGIRVNALVPGAIVTARQSDLWRNPEEDKKFIELQCLKFHLESIHVAKPTLFLASDDSEGITGHNLIVDAGLAQVSVVG